VSSGSGRQEPAQPEVYRITSAVGSRSADMQQRATRYLLSMGIRTVCVILVIIVPGPLRWVFAVGAIVLPYIAVVSANAAGERREPPLPPPPPVERPGLTGTAPSAPVRAEHVEHERR
jgi:Protein of unknown function (DUF3099)